MRLRSPLEISLTLLRKDALERGMHILAVSYGWSLIRLMGDEIQRQLKESKDS